MNRLYIILLLLCGLIALVSADGTSPSRQHPQHTTTISHPPASRRSQEHPRLTPLRRSTNTRNHPNNEVKRAASSSCSQCTKAFCLSRGIDFCREATEENVQTMCFQRDSNKDRVIVWGFLLGTTGLLGWAAFKHAQELREGKRAAEAAAAAGGRGRRGDYSPLGAAGGN
ncbi:hypothetical protein CSOJ01_14381 [Colletotrichum sojae]|uniref:MFS transporter n=1 Tax=Colletotrichum sojae TaxID=2175907 RepID=A0A8H6MK67_9PEZI|nr:hypothetical protein CSOJ01_14381 [Colletotrichum sojae]